YKARTSPYSFQGTTHVGLEILVACRAETGLPVVTEVMEPGDVDHVADVADALKVGARNMQNFSLLKEVGKSGKPVMLKRGLSATVEEWLMAAEYIAQQGNSDIVLCERGIRTFEPSTRNTLDLSGMVVAQQETHLPVIVDPSHATGRHDLVAPMSKAALAAGADGVMIDVHPHPTAAPPADCLVTIKGVDLQNATILDIQQAMARPDDPLTSVELVQRYLDRIRFFDPLLNSIRELNPNALQEAAASDAERAAGVDT